MYLYGRKTLQSIYFNVRAHFVYFSHSLSPVTYRVKGKGYWGETLFVNVMGRLCRCISFLDHWISLCLVTKPHKYSEFESVKWGKIFAFPITLMYRVAFFFNTWWCGQFLRANIVCYWRQHGLLQNRMWGSRMLDLAPACVFKKVLWSRKTVNRFYGKYLLFVQS